MKTSELLKLNKITESEELKRKNFNSKNLPRKVDSLEEFLKESPNLYSNNIKRQEDLNGNNEEETRKIIERSKYLEIFDYKGLKYRLYMELEGDCIYYYLIHADFDGLLLIHQVSPTKLINLNGVESVDIWQNHILRDITKKIARCWIFDYILKNYDFIMSDKIHTPLGKSFWIKLIKEAFERKLNVIVYNTNDNKYSNLINLDNIEDFYGIQNKSHYRFIILKS